MGEYKVFNYKQSDLTYIEASKLSYLSIEELSGKNHRKYR